MPDRKEREYSDSTQKIAFPEIRKKFTELGGLKKIAKGDNVKYVRLYNALVVNQNPTLLTIREILEITGLTFEEAFSNE